LKHRNFQKYGLIENSLVSSFFFLNNDATFYLWTLGHKAIVGSA
jgi:hypothetical protein